MWNGSLPEKSCGFASHPFALSLLFLARTLLLTAHCQSCTQWNSSGIILRVLPFQVQSIVCRTNILLWHWHHLEPLQPSLKSLQRNQQFNTSFTFARSSRGPFYRPQIAKLLTSQKATSTLREWLGRACKPLLPKSILVSCLKHTDHHGGMVMIATLFDDVYHQCTMR